MLKKITISKDMIMVQDIPTNESTIDVENNIVTDVIMEKDQLKAIEIIMTADQAAEFARALSSPKLEQEAE